MTSAVRPPAPAAGSAATRAVERYRDAHRVFMAAGAASGPGWLSALRTSAIERFGHLGFPTTKQEAWRFTSVAPLLEQEFALPARSAARPLDTADLEPLLLGDAAAPRLVFVNGHFQEQLSRPAADATGVRIESLARAVAGAPELVRAHLGRYAGHEDQAFRALNAAFLADGAFIHIARGRALEPPIQLLYLTTAVSGAPAMTHPRTVIVLEREARATVVETYASIGEAGGQREAGAWGEGDGDRVYWTNAVTEIAVGDGARLDCYRVQGESARAYHVATTESHQGRDSVLNLHTVAIGAALARHELRIVLDGTGAVGLLNGLYLLRDGQHVDHHTLIDHAQPHGESHEYFNGVLDGSARSVFTGRIIVRPGAQRTDSKQTNNNLLLSTEARADSQPQLEIYADDVKCTHGSTTGPLDERQLFYATSRGLGRDEARRLLAYGFAADILRRMEIGPLRERLDGIVRARVWQ